MFFRNNENSPLNLLRLSEEDFHHQNTKQPIRITLTFEDLSADAQTEFKAYYRQNRLVVLAKAVWNEKSQKADIIQFGIRFGIEDFKKFFRADIDTKSDKDLKDIYAEIREKYTILPTPGTKASMIESLRDYEESHDELSKEIQTEEEAYGFTKGTHLLNKYVQCVYIPAVKDASSEQEEGAKTALKQMLDRTIRKKIQFKERIDELKGTLAEEYSRIIESGKDALSALRSSIQSRLQDWSSTDTSFDLQWF